MVSVKTPSDVVGWDWYDYHLEHFVKAYLGHVPDLLPESDPYRKGLNGAYYYIAPSRSYLTYQNMRRLKAVWDRAKKDAGSWPILLAGRDVWPLEVMARMEGYPTTFRSDISSHTRSDVVEDYSNYYLIDTGFRGSVPLALGTKKWKLISHYKENISGLPKKLITRPGGFQVSVPACAFTNYRQLFPYANSHFTNLAGTLESLPKYWNQAQLTYDKNDKLVMNPDHPTKVVIKQTMAPPGHFEQAVIITRFVVEHLFPRPPQSIFSLR